MHNGLLKMKSGKMAGSIGNVLNVADALKAVGGDVLRFFILGTHYRSPIDLGDWDPKSGSVPTGLESAKSALRAYYQFFERYQELTGTSFYSLEAMSAKEFRESGEFGAEFLRLMDDDFNTGGAVGVMFQALGQAKAAANTAQGDQTDLKRLARQLRTMANILGLFWAPPQEKKLGGGDQLVAGLMQLLLDLRENLRKIAKEAAKDNPLKKSLFDQTDLIRKRLGELGVTLEDRPGGTTWRVG
jgi:cysteinyl-tRNA synthetase